MSQIFLKLPTIDDKYVWIDYITERYGNSDNMNEVNFVRNFNYDEWLDKINNEKEGINLPPGRVPSSLYLLMDKDRVIGSVSIRHTLEGSKFLSTYGGHIGYGIRPSERRKGYGTLALRLALEKCLELGLDNVMVSCKEDNIGSAKIIENNMGTLSKIEYSPEEGCNLKIYWINVKEALKERTR